MNIAVVTGASSGMGKEFCKRLDNAGLDEIWAIALDSAGLEVLQGECKTKVRALPFDLTQSANFEKYNLLLSEVKPNITWLFNCSGFGKFARYDEIPVEVSANMIELNCIALVKMTEYSLPYMQKGARIVQIASVAGWQPTPYINVYAATKAFVISYSRGLNRELKSRGISVTTICPFWTKTKFFDRAIDKDDKVQVVTKYVAMYTPEYVVDKAMQAAMKRKDLVVVGTKAKMQCAMVKMLPHSLVMDTWIRQQKLNKKYKNK